jgi:hypothetical protein
MTMKIHHKRRKRRTAKQVIKHGRNAKSRHNNPAGRTGQIHAKKTKPKMRDVPAQLQAPQHERASF